MDLQKALEQARQELKKLPFIKSITSHITTDTAEIKLEITTPLDFQSFARYLNRRPTTTSIIKINYKDPTTTQIQINPLAKTHSEKSHQIIHYLKDITDSAKNYAMKTKH